METSTQLRIADLGLFGALAAPVVAWSLGFIIFDSSVKLATKKLDRLESSLSSTKERAVESRMEYRRAYAEMRKAADNHADPVGRSRHLSTAISAYQRAEEAMDGLQQGVAGALGSVDGMNKE